MMIRPEHPSDARHIRALVEAAFHDVAQSSRTEGAIVDALRRNGALTISLVAEQGGAIVGHVALSPVLIDGRDIGWFGLGPVAVSPEHQRRGIGTALIDEGIWRLRQHGAKGCVVLGDPGYYGRFGFESARDLRYGDVPPGPFQMIAFSGEPASGEVTYDRGFEAP